MKKSDKILIGYFISLILFIIIGLQFIPMLMILGYLAYYFLYPNKEAEQEKISTKSKKVFEETPAFVDFEEQRNEIEGMLFVLQKEYKRKIRERVEYGLNETLENALQILRQLIPCYTAALFFRGKKDAFYLRTYISDSNKIIDGVTIDYGKGLVGYVAKDTGGRIIQEGNITRESTTLYYYQEDDGIRSFMAVPLIIKGILRGAAVVDSRNMNAFDTRHRKYLESFSKVISELVYNTYLQLENRIDRDKLSTLVSLQKEFFKQVSIKEIINVLAEILRISVEASRFTISLLAENNQEAVIHYAYGLDSEFYQDFKFPFKEKGVVSLVYEKNQTIQRCFVSGKYVPHFSVREKVNKEISSILAIPITSATGDKCIGAMAFESEKRNQFSHVEIENLQNFALCVGLAIDKINLLETQKKLATIDPLTQLPNRRSFLNVLSSELKRADRYHYSVSLIMADIDFFKKINDTYGHPAGDLVLKKVAEMLQHSIRDGVDLSARYGGEEFSCILVDTDAQKAQETAERIRQQVENNKFDLGGSRIINITMSFGICAYPKLASSKQDLIKRSDDALYKAKKQGRNRVIIW